MNHPNIPIWLAPAFPVVVISLWVGVLHVLSRAGGWRDLASSYGTNESIDGKNFTFRTGRIGTVNYSSCLRFTAGRTGLRIAVLTPFRFGHRPLLVPWCDVSGTEHRGWVFRYVDIRFEQQPHVSLRLTRNLADSLIAAGGNLVRIGDEQPGTWVTLVRVHG